MGNQQRIESNTTLELFEMWISLLIGVAVVIGVHSECIQGPYGGGGGGPFSDRAYGNLGKIKTVKIRSQRRIDSIQFTYGNFDIFTLEEDEVIVRVNGRSQSRVDSLTFHTSKGRQYGPYGGFGGREFVAMGDELRFVSGRSQSEVDQIQFHFENC